MLENDLALLADTNTESEVEVRYGFVVDEIAAAANFVITLTLTSRCLQDRSVMLTIGACVEGLKLGCY